MKRNTLQLKDDSGNVVFVDARRDHSLITVIEGMTGQTDVMELKPYQARILGRWLLTNYPEPSLAPQDVEHP